MVPNMLAFWVLGGHLQKITAGVAPLFLGLGRYIGRGYPNITMGDGIYSAYLTQQSTPQHQQKSYLSVVLKTDYNNGKFLFPRRTNEAG